jgi:F0F1-type ATP synthase membrane subunit b/b'
MAATPTLVPDPTVIAVQGVIFLTAVVLVKKLMLDPYERLRVLRSQQTTGSSDAAKGLAQRNAEIQFSIEKALNETIAAAKSSAEAVRNKFQSERDRIIKDAETGTVRQTETAVNQLQKELEAQENKISEEAARLTKQIVEALSK